MASVCSIPAAAITKAPGKDHTAACTDTGSKIGGLAQFGRPRVVCSQTGWRHSRIGRLVIAHIKATALGSAIALKITDIRRIHAAIHRPTLQSQMIIIGGWVHKGSRAAQAVTAAGNCSHQIGCIVGK